MSSALEAFRLQREAVEEVHAQLKVVARLVERVRAEAATIAQDETLRQVLRDEERWLESARRTIAEVRAFREYEVRRFWPGTWRRWAVAVVFALASVAAFGAGYVSTAGPYEKEIASLRLRGELLDKITQRILAMTPAERRQLDGLMKWNAGSQR